MRFGYVQVSATAFPRAKSQALLIFLAISLIAMLTIAALLGGGMQSESVMGFSNQSKAHDMTPDSCYDAILSSIIPSDSRTGIREDIASLRGRSKSPSQQEIAYLVSATAPFAKRGPKEEDAKELAIVQEGVRYLLEEGYREGETPKWGLFFEWDAFGDGSVNPASASYGITVASVIHALCDALECQCLDPTTSEQVERALHDICIDWCVDCYTAMSGGYFWYSDQVQDDINCPNVSAEVAGALARAVSTYPDLFSEDESSLVKGKIAGALNLISDRAILIGGAPVWEYTSNSGRRNDLVHQVFTLERITEARRNGLRPWLQWDAASELQSVLMYQNGDELWHEADGASERSPATLYDAGAALWFLSASSDVTAADSTFSFLRQKYSSVLGGTTDDVRESCFVLKGLSFYRQFFE